MTAAGLLLCATVSQALLVGGAVTHTHTGQLATRSAVPTSFIAGLKYIQSKSGHIFRTPATEFKIVIPCWMVVADGAAGTGTEVALGANCDVAAGIEYPDNVFTQVRFSGSASATITDGTSLVSDTISLNVPRDALVYVRIWLHNTAGIISAGLGFAVDTASPFNEGATCSATVIADKTISGTIVGSQCHVFPPIAIVGNSPDPSICIIGDSRATGSDIMDGSGDNGDIAPSVGAHFGYIKFAISGTSAAQFVAGPSTRRIALSNAYCTDVIVELGGNDTFNATLQTNLTTIYGYFTGRVWQTTFEPISTSNNQWIDLAGQTASLQPGLSNTNDWIRTTPAPLAGYFDLADATETSRSSGKWKFDGTPFKYTVDGRHGSVAGYALIVAANAIPSSAFHYP